MSGLDQEKLRKLRQKQETSFVPALFHRPLAILFLLPSADWRWVTPDRLTTVSIGMRVAAAWLLWPGVSDLSGLILGLILWHLGCVLDAMDGALARYRGASSSFGRFYDKVSDRLITLVMGIMLAARASDLTGDPRYGLLAMIYISVHSSASVAKWIELGITPSDEGKALDPLEVDAPQRSLSQWARYIAKSTWTGLYVSEVDLPFWGTIAVVTQHEDWLLIYLVATAVPYAFWIIFRRARRLWWLDHPKQEGPQLEDAKV